MKSLVYVLIVKVREILVRGQIIPRDLLRLDVVVSVPADHELRGVVTRDDVADVVDVGTRVCMRYPNSTHNFSDA